MQRRLLLAVLATLPAANARAQEEEARPHQLVAAAQLYEALAARFPVRAGVPGLVQLQVSAPQLLLLPPRNKLGALLQLQASGAALQRALAGELELVFGLRYAPADRSVRARDPEVLQLRLPGVPQSTVQSLQGLLPALARQATGELVLHRFSARELALPETMGLEPDRLTVREDGLLVEFAPKPLR